MTTRANGPLRAGIGRRLLLHKEYASVVSQLNTDLQRATLDFMVMFSPYEVLSGETKLELVPI